MEDVLGVWGDRLPLRRVLAPLDSKEGWAKRRSLLPSLSHVLCVAGVGKSSLLLRFADNTFSGKSSLGAVGSVLVLESQNPSASV